MKQKGVKIRKPNRDVGILKKTGKKNIWLLIRVPLQCLDGDLRSLRSAVLPPIKPTCIVRAISRSGALQC